MRFPTRIITLIIILTAAACATQPPRFRDEALVKLEEIKLAGGERLKPAEYASSLQAFLKGDALLAANETEDAERYFQLTLLKGEFLERILAEEARKTAEAALEAARQAERERQQKLEAERVAKARAEARARAAAEAAAAEALAEAERRRARPQKEQQLVNNYTVRRGESLPLVASHPEVYGDRSLWPLIYRANRAQIRDPRHIWPGQVLRIPRNVGRDDIAEARRYAQERPL